MQNIKMLCCRLYIASFAHERIRHIVKYFSRYLITTAKHTVKIEPIKYLGKVHACLSYSSMCRKSNLYVKK